MKTNIRPLVFALLLTPLLANPTQAQDASTPPTSNIDEVTENLRTRLKNSVASEQEINLIEEAARLRAYVGVVTDIVQDNIILEDKSGKKNVKILSDSTIIRSPGNKEIDLESVRIDDSIIAIGDPTAEDELDGKRLIVSEDKLSPPEKLSGLATITAVNRYSFTLQEPDKSEPLELYFTNQTLYKSPSERLDQDDIIEGSTILYTAVTDKDGDWSATNILQIRPGASSELTKEEESVE